MKCPLAILALFLAAALSLAQSPPADTTQHYSPPPAFRIAPPPKPSPEKTIEFPIGEGVGRGDDLCIPIKINGKEHLFLIDTGAGNTVLDSSRAASLKELLGSPVGKREHNSLTGTNVEFLQYHFPVLEARGQRLKNSGEPIETMNMELLRESNGRPIEGILGQDVLSQYVVRLDFRHHIMEFIDPLNFQAAGDNIAKAYSMIDGRPVITLSFANVPNVPVIIDTGDNGFGTITPDILHNVPPAEIITLMHRTITDISGNVEIKLVRIKCKWSIADTAFENVPMVIASYNSIGLRACADFILTFDFSNKQIYLESLCAHHPAEPPFLDITIDLKDGRFIIDEVTEQVKKLDIQVNDQLLAVDGKDISKTELWLLREQLKKAPAPILRLKRGDQTHEVTLHHDQPTTTTAPAP